MLCSKRITTCHGRLCIGLVYRAICTLNLDRILGTIFQLQLGVPDLTTPKPCQKQLQFTQPSVTHFLTITLTPPQVSPCYIMIKSNITVPEVLN